MLSLLGVFVFSPALNAAEFLTPKSLVGKMEEAYARVHNYETDVEVKTYEADGKVDVKRFRFWFKKPGRLRMKFESPYHGMVIIYPDLDGKVLIHEFLTFHRPIDDPVMVDKKTGQRLDQTGIGPFIDMIAQTLGENRRGPVDITEDESYVSIRVPADDYFHPGIKTQYEFLIDKRLWLPVKVEQSTEEGRRIRMTAFHDVHINLIIPDDLFTRQ